MFANLLDYGFHGAILGRGFHEVELYTVTLATRYIIQKRIKGCFLPGFLNRPEIAHGTHKIFFMGLPLLISLKCGLINT